MNEISSLIDDAPLLTDEVEVMKEWLPLNGASILDIGCGPAPISRKLLEQTSIAEVVLLETDSVALSKLKESELPPNMSVLEGVAQELPFPDARFDGVLMMKSLHHVPVHCMDGALNEAARVLRDGGVLYVSEPVYAGAFNNVLRLFHDEGRVRHEALEAIKRAVEGGKYTQETEYYFNLPSRFENFSDFENRIIKASHNAFNIEPCRMSEIREEFEKHLGNDGAYFPRPMRINVLKKAAAN